MKTNLAFTKNPLVVAILIATVLACVVTGIANASETMESFRKSLDHLNKESSSDKLPTQSDTELVLSSTVIDTAKVSGYPSADKALASACAGSKGGLCKDQAKAAKIYSAASRALGIPAATLICLTKQESGFEPNRTSSTGAKGLTQVMPATARDLQRAMKSGFSKEWDEFKKLGGTTRSSSAFTASAMRSGSLKDADVQIFESAMHFRYYARPMESTLQEKFGAKSKSNVKNVMNYFLASYNGGPGTAKRACQTSDMNVKRLPKETQGYLKAIDGCLNKASGGRAGSL